MMKPKLNRQQFMQIAAQPRRFAQGEDGTITIFACFMVLMMLMIGGIGVDMMHHEMERTRIQAVADRAVLAAADLDQTLDPEAVVRDYFAKSGMADFVSNVTVDEGLNYRTVTVDASTSMKTQFMNTLGVSNINVPAYSQAEEKVNKVEISLVLDISGSMASNNKMDNLHDAAGAFLDSVLKPETADLISVSVIPYTAQVNAGEEIFDELNINAWNPTYTHCVDFETSDFNQVALSLTKSYKHMQFFEAGYYWNRNSSEGAIDNPGCPKRDYEEIAAFSQDKNALKTRINKFRPRANTAIHLGMKWGVAMLDPAFRPITEKLSTVDGVFANRPAAYSDVETLKTIILMTDGENVSTVRIQDSKYDSKSERKQWSRYPLYYWLNQNVRSNKHYRWAYTKYTPGQADSMLSNICAAARAKNIVIWSIGFEVSNHGANVMRDCASSPSHFFRVEGVEITEAFSAIARQINQLRLTQ
ncbi:MAG: Flp pilus assembly protein TadG [Sulfitobacter sp.]|jgi:Flp pilus assembly protein TadG